MRKKNKITLELSNAEVNRLTKLIFKGTAYNSCYYDRRTCTLDEKFKDMIYQMIVDGSEKYKDKNINAGSFNGELREYEKGYILF